MNENYKFVVLGPGGRLTEAESKGHGWNILNLPYTI